VTTRPLELAETVFRLYQDLLRRRTGFLVADLQRSRLESRLGAEARSAGSFYQLYGRLRNEPTSSPLFGRLLDAAVNGETCFFRDPASIRAFSEEIAPERLLAGGQDGVLTSGPPVARRGRKRTASRSSSTSAEFSRAER
jgi:chemotaxis methyl-accepting protein methylase